MSGRAGGAVGGPMQGRMERAMPEGVAITDANRKAILDFRESVRRERHARQVIEQELDAQAALVQQMCRSRLSRARVAILLHITVPFLDRLLVRAQGVGKAPERPLRATP